MILVFVLVMMLAGWELAMVVGWRTVRVREHQPWNWRVLACPWAYRAWLDRQAEEL